MPKVLAVLQARCSSSRLPRKVLAPILGRPMLVRHLERVRRATRLDQVIVATSVHADDAAIAEAAAEAGVECFRGALDDVLDRFRAAAQGRGAAHVVRLTGDCPLADPAVIDAVVERHLALGCDYTSNILELCYPDGLDVEVLRIEALERAWREATTSYEREHVTPYLYGHPELFRLGNLRREPDLSHLRLTVDQPEDLAVVRRIFDVLYTRRADFALEDVLALLAAEPELVELNAPHNARLTARRAAGRTSLFGDPAP